MGVLRRRFCVDMIGGKGIYLFLVGLGYDACVRGKFSSVLLTCGGCVRSILLLSLAARCWETIVVCMSRMFAFMSAVVTVQGSVGMFVVQKSTAYTWLDCCCSTQHKLYSLLLPPAMGARFYRFLGRPAKWTYVCVCVDVNSWGGTPCVLHSITEAQIDDNYELLCRLWSPLVGAEEGGAVDPYRL